MVRPPAMALAPPPPPSGDPGEDVPLAADTRPGGPPSSAVEHETPELVRGGLLWRLGGVVLTVRPHQWVKNVFVLAPVVFAKELFEPAMLSRSAGAFGVFCLLAGAVYAMNDVADVEADRAHPVKRHRPIASGRVPVPLARALAVALVVVSLGAAVLMGPWELAAVAATYFGINLAYSLRLKHVAYVDVLCIAAGFVLRVWAGGFATAVQVSWYLLLCTGLLALFLGFGKRRHELAAAAANAGRQRAALEAYSQRGLDAALAVTALATTATYVAYTLDPHTRELFRSDHLWPSTLFVLAGVGRFLQLVRSRPKSESPTQEMLRDGPFVAIVLLWVAIVLFVVYQLRPMR